MLLCMLGAADASAASVRLNVQSGRGRREIGVGDLFYITYEVTDADASPTRPTDVPGAKIMYFDQTGSMSSFSSVNGRTTQTSSITWTLTLRAQKEGTYTFGPVQVGNLKSNQVTYTIGQAAQPQAPGQPQADPQRQDPNAGPKFIGKGDGNLYLKANVSRTSAYEQEALVYTVQLLTTYDAIKFIGATSAPKFDGFVVEESKDTDTQLSYETVNGKTYASAIIARYIIFPQMPGKLKITGNTYTVSVDAREYYHDPFWGNMSVSKPLQLNVTPNDLTVDVKALPFPKPADFSGGVGEFKITSTLPNQVFKTNQAAQIVYQVTGTGNLKYVKLPDLAALYPPQLEVYTPVPDVNATVGRNNVEGSVRFDCSFMPLEEGEFAIPSVKLTYFNPRSGKYETTVAKGYDVTVGKGKGSDKSQTKGHLSFNPALAENGTPQFAHTPWVYRFPYWLFYILPVLILAGVSVYYRAYLKANADLLAVKSRKANKMARMRLRKAAAAMKGNDAVKFYDEMLSALWGYVGDKLKMPPSELTRQNVSGQLLQHGVDREAVSALIGLLDECEFAKYAPGQASGSESGIYDKGVETINSLEEEFRKARKNASKQ